VFAINKSVVNHECYPVKEKRIKKKNKGNHDPSPPPLPSGSFKCPQCDQRFDNDDELLCHRISFCVARFACNVEGCGKMFTTLREVSYHNLKEHDTVEKVCDQCGFTTKFNNKLERHKKKMHDPNYQKVVSEAIPCADCGKILHTKHSYDHHVEAFHSGPRKLFECHMCPDVRFRTFQSIQSHMGEHLSDEMLLPCDICDKKFVTPVLKEKHMRVHRSELENEGISLREGSQSVLFFYRSSEKHSLSV
jgi:Zinc finger, C2H2 type